MACPSVHPIMRAESREQRAESSTPAPLNYRRPSTFSAACGRTFLVLLAALSAALFSGGNTLAQTPGSTSDENQRTGQHILNAPVAEDEAVLYRSTATLTPVDHIGNTHGSREDRNASFVRVRPPDDFEEPDNYNRRTLLRGLNERRIGTLRTAISATDLTIQLTSVTGLRVGESLEIGRSGSTHNGELMRIGSIDTANNSVTVVERFDARGAQFAAPQAWPAGTVVDHHRRARPENLPGYMTDSGQNPTVVNFGATWQGRDTPYLAMNLAFPGGDSQLKDWEQLLIYTRFRRADGTGTVIEGILPLAADAEFKGGPLGDPYTVREQHLRRYLGWPENLDNDPDGSHHVALVNDANRAAEFITGPERTFLQEMIDWIYEDNGHDLGRIYPWDDRYSATELAALETYPPTASEDVVRSYQIVVDVALLNSADPRIDVEQFSITPAAANAAPSFTPGAAAFTVAENQTAVGAVQASDGDKDDEVTGYAIEGGADQSKFSLGSASGVLAFQTAPNFEAPQDADTNNTYVVVVRATSGTGTRLKTADQTVTVTVTDVNTEAPGVPEAPVVSSASVSSLTVGWSAPSNQGPAITDYDHLVRAPSTALAARRRP